MGKGEGIGEEGKQRRKGLGRAAQLEKGERDMRNESEEEGGESDQ